MEYTHEEIIEALKVISNICANTDCEECCFSDKHDECIINNYQPAKWVINPTQIWRAVASN